MNDTAAPPGTQAVDRAALLIDTVVRADEPLTFLEIAESSGLPRSTTSRLLSALERTGLLEHEVGIEEDRVLLDPLAGRPEEVERAVAHELHADLRDQPPPPPVELGKGVLAEHVVAGHLVLEHGDFLLRLTRWLRHPSLIMWKWNPTS